MAGRRRIRYHAHEGRQRWRATIHEPEKERVPNRTGRGPSALLTVNEIPIEDTFAEAFPMTAVRLVVTAETPAWARTAGTVATGYAASVIGCDAEAGIERVLAPEETPDGRPGVSLLLFGFSRDALQKAVVNRVGQCVLTCPTTACYNGLPTVKDKTIRVGGNLRFFGDGWQFSKKLEGRRYWRLPVMDGEFLCEDLFGTVKGVAGGNFLILGVSQAEALAAAEAAVAAIRQVPGVILPFPGGLVRSGSKVGSRYKKLRASTNDAYCPTLRGSVKSDLPEGANAVYEIVIDGVDLAAVEKATRVGVRAACRPGVVRISAGNYGGNLGPFHLYLHQLLKGE
jgi:formylmethanofuran--tetrahydromethanopterin N-formyltransferase